MRKLPVIRWGQPYDSLDGATGAVDWRFDAGGSFTASPVVVDGRIIIGNGDGTLYCFGAPRQQEGLTTEDMESTEENTEKNSE